MAGETLTLNAGESLVFGSDGNIECTDMSIVTDGGIQLEAIGETERRLKRRRGRGFRKTLPVQLACILHKG